VESIRKRIEDFIRRHGVLRVLAIAVAVVLVFLLARRALRRLRVPTIAVAVVLVAVA
jgi:cell division protein FtsW (lipid II flippase)